jgi:CBS domain-containing protein
LKQVKNSLHHKPFYYLLSNTLIGKDKILMTIGELMSNKLETIEASDLVQVAAKKMHNKKISSLVVIDNSNNRWGS